MTAGREHLQIILSDHASITDEDQPVEPEPPVQVGHGFLDRGVVNLVARPDVMAIGQPETITTATIT